MSGIVLDTLGDAIKNSDLSNDEIIELINKTIGNQKYDLAISYTKLYLKKGEEKNDNRIRYNSYYYLAYLYYLQQKTSDVSISVDNAMKFLPAENKKNNAFKVLLLKGSAYMNNSEYEKAISTYLKANSYIDTPDINEASLSIKLNIAQCKIRIKRYQDALNDLLSIKKHISDPSVIQKLTEHNQQEIPFTTYNAMGICYRELGMYEKAIQVFLENFEQIKEYGPKTNLSLTYLNIGKTYYAMDDCKKAEQNLRLSRGLFIELELKNENFIMTSYLLANCLFKKSEYAEAKKILDEGIPILERNKKTENAVEMMELAIKNAEHLNDLQSEMKYTKLLTSIQKDLYLDRNRSKDLLFDKQIDELEEDKEKLFFSNRKNKIYLRFILIVTCIASIGLFFHNKKQRKKNNILFEKFTRNLQEVEKVSEQQTSTILTNNAILSDKKTNNIIHELEKLEESLFYIDAECTLHSTAKRLHTNTTYLSKIINKYKNQTFTNYINDLRISYAIEQLNNGGKYKSYSVKGISEDLGYKSVNTFNTAFKKATNLSPSFYVKQIKKKELSQV
ncbi:tetratricopeptide repeat protein [Aquimarina pacifica]|uniref:tetratricopeptide repeat protein n=1 Tax=Aquimarina pacifica TaxID=1296415 RepID=UPI000470A3A3|nr:tetratricopeptide repeat protein [Aquimarina pacifica]